METKNNPEKTSKNCQKMANFWTTIKPRVLKSPKSPFFGSIFFRPIFDPLLLCLFRKRVSKNVSKIWSENGPKTLTFPGIGRGSEKKWHQSRRTSEEIGLQFLIQKRIKNRVKHTSKIDPKKIIIIIIRTKNFPRFCPFFDNFWPLFWPYFCLQFLNQKPHIIK